MCLISGGEEKRKNELSFVFELMWQKGLPELSNKE
jgi:hypothetical protein